MIGALARFVEALRRAGVVVSPAEILDASRALDAVGVHERVAVRGALRATLAKDRRAGEVFDAVFNRFFVPPRGGSHGPGEGRAGAEGERRRPGGGPERAGGPPRRPAESEPARPKGSRRDERPRDDRRDGRRTIVGDLARTLAASRASAGRREGRLRKILVARTPRDAPGDPTRTDLARKMTTDEERRLAREVPALVQEIRIHAGRRLTRARSGRPWLRRAFRESLVSGGVPFVIPFRALRRRRPRVVLLVDVSYSVARAAGLFLLMASEFLTLGRRVVVLAFVDKPVDATAAIARWTAGRGKGAGDRAVTLRARRTARPGDGVLAGGVAFSDLLAGILELNLDAPSDYGRALHALLTGRRRPRGRDTILVVLGDGRTNRFDPLPWALEELARGCRAVLWLSPEPASRWGTADSALPAYLPFVDLVAETTDLVGLARGVAAIVRRL